MSDRELLELAAKAAGLGPLDFDYPEREGHGFDMGPRLPMPQGVMMAAMWQHWLPLEDDGDALRLAARLELRTSIAGTKAIANWWRRPAMIELDNEVVPVGDDPCAALRRVIVLAAAEIGKATP